MAEEGIVLLGCGDVGPGHEPIDRYSTLVQPTLAAGDIRFAQCEKIYSERSSVQLQASYPYVDPSSPLVMGGGSHSGYKPHMASVFSDCGFDIVSMAGNHAMDYGPDAMLDTIDLLRGMGIQTLGAGRNIEEARQAVIVERKGIKVAFLAYCSILRDGYAAGPNKPGAAPLRAHTYYRPLEYQAGMAPKVVTIPYEEDVAGMVEDIKKAKMMADSVVVSIHWGLHFIPREIADYQPVVAEAAFNAGADLILGGHAHVPKAIGVHGGKVCFYSLSNFIFTNPMKTGEDGKAFARRYGIDMDNEYSAIPGITVPYGADAKRSLIAKAVLTRKGVKKVSFLPVLIDRQLRPEVLRAGDPRFDDAVKFMDWASEDFDHKFVVEGDEIVIT